MARMFGFGGQERKVNSIWSDMKVLTLCGSLRVQSSNRALLRAYESVAGARAAFTHYERLSYLPHFNPDLDTDEPPIEVADLRAQIRGADVLVVSTPEYAHALPGSFKNALDWLVSDSTFLGKPVIILGISRESTWALESLKEILRTMSSRVIETASCTVSLGSNQASRETILLRQDVCNLLETSINALMSEV